MQHELNTIWPRQMLRRAHAVPCRRPLFARFAGLALPPHPLCRAPARIRACAAAFRINRPETMPCHPHACLVTHRTLPPSPKQMWVLDRPGGDQPCPPPSIPPPGADLDSILLGGTDKIVFRHGVIPGSSHTKAQGISSPGTYEATPMWPCNDGERQWNIMSDWTCR